MQDRKVSSHNFDELKCSKTIFIREENVNKPDDITCSFRSVLALPALCLYNMD